MIETRVVLQSGWARACCHTNNLNALVSYEYQDTCPSWISCCLCLTGSSLLVQAYKESISGTLLDTVEWITLPQNSYVKIWTHNGMLFGDVAFGIIMFRYTYEGGTLRISTLIRRDSRDLSFSVSVSLTLFLALWGHDRKQPGKRALTRTWPCWYPDLRLPGSRTARKYISVVWATQSMAFYYGGST